MRRKICRETPDECSIEVGRSRYRFAAWLVALALLAGTLPVRAEPGSDDVVGGRLGGSLRSFVDRFGEPIGANEAAGVVFGATGYGPIFVQVDHVQGTVDADGRARTILTGAPRDPGRPATEPDAADWTLDEGRERVRALLPTDAGLTEFAATGVSGQRAATCQSDALAEIFGVLTLGQCRVTVIQPTAETVSFVTLALITGSELDAGVTPAANPCEGALEWIRYAGERMERARDLLNEVASVDESDPGAVATLRAIADSFEELLAGLRERGAPVAATPAHDLLIAALESYAVAAGAAADGLATGDAGVIAEAVAGIEDGSALVVDATAALHETASACRLVIGTPAPVATPPGG